MKFDYWKLRSEWKRRKKTDTEIAELIGISRQALVKKNADPDNANLTATQAAVICAYIGTTFEMFITKDTKQ